LLAPLQTASRDIASSPLTPSKTCRWPRFDGKLVTSPKNGKEQVFQVMGSPYGMNGSIETVTFPAPPTATKLTFSLSFRAGAANQTYSFQAVGIDPKAKTFPWTCQWSNSGPLSKSRWTVARQTYSLPNGTKFLQFVIHNPGEEPFFISAPHLSVGEACPPDPIGIENAQRVAAEVEEDRKHPKDSPVQIKHDELARQEGPVLIKVMERAPVLTMKPNESGTVSFPIPMRDESQVPLAFRILTEPAGRLESFKWLPRSDGRNWICQATVKPGVKGTWVKYEALVLVRKAPAADNLVGDWDANSACVQSGNAEIKQLAAKLAEGTNGLNDYVKKVYGFVLTNMGTGGAFKTLDARAALDCGGSCTNRANLAAALLRAHGIPARTVSHMPTWCGPLYEHWLTEYWDPSAGWTAFDPSLGRLQPDRRTRVNLCIASLSDENKAFDPLHERFVMPGAPYLSVMELSSTLYPADLAKDDAINQATQLCNLPESASSTLFVAGENTYKQLMNNCQRGQSNASSFAALEKAAGKGASALELALKN
jgi:hypothetical protein